MYPLKFKLSTIQTLKGIYFQEYILKKNTEELDIYGKVVILLNFKTSQ